MKITLEQLTAAVAEIDRLIRDGGMHYAEDFRKVEDSFCDIMERHFGEFVDGNPAYPLFMVMDTFEFLQKGYRETDESMRRFCRTPEDFDDHDTFCIDLTEKWDSEIVDALVEAEDLILRHHLERK